MRDAPPLAHVPMTPEQHARAKLEAMAIAQREANPQLPPETFRVTETGVWIDPGGDKVWLLFSTTIIDPTLVLDCRTGPSSFPVFAREDSPFAGNPNP